MFPTLAQMQMAMLGYAASELNHGGMEEYAGELENRVEQCRRASGNLDHLLDLYKQEYTHLLKYTAELKELYAAVFANAHKEHRIRYPMPPAGMIASLKARVAQLNFFEAGSDAPPKERRVYKRAFAKGSTRSVYCELNLRHIPPANKIDFDMDFLWHNAETGDFSSKSTSYILPEWEYSWHTHRIGWDEPGKWPKGEYAVHLFVGDEYAVSGSFEIV
jgi:hypothetical protein